MEYLSKGLMPAGRPLTLNLLRLSGTMDKFHLQNLELAECRNIMALDFGKLMTGPKEISILLQSIFFLCYQYDCSAAIVCTGYYFYSYSSRFRWMTQPQNVLGSHIMQCLVSCLS